MDKEINNMLVGGVGKQVGFMEMKNISRYVGRQVDEKVQVGR